MFRTVLNSKVVLALGGLLICAVGLFATFGPNWYVSKRDFSSNSSLECTTVSNQVIGFSVGVDEATARQFPVLKNLTSLIFESVKITNGDVRFITGLFVERPDANQPTVSLANWPAVDNNQWGSYSFYGSYGQDDPEAGDSGVGLARLFGGGRIEIKAQAGSLVKFRAAPLKSKTMIFDGKWERPYDDSGLTERMDAFLRIALEIKDRCR